ALDRLTLRYTPPTVTVRPPAVLQGPVCGDVLDARVAVIQRPNVACTSAVCSGRKRPGRARVTATARAGRGTRPRHDRGSYVLRCLPRVPPCSETTTTSTSTTSTMPPPPTTSSTPTSSTTSTPTSSTTSTTTSSTTSSSTTSTSSTTPSTT